MLFSVNFFILGVISLLLFIYAEFAGILLIQFSLPLLMGIYFFLCGFLRQWKIDRLLRNGELVKAHIRKIKNPFGKCFPNNTNQGSSRVEVEISGGGMGTDTISISIQDHFIDARDRGEEIDILRHPDGGKAVILVDRVVFALLID